MDNQTRNHLNLQKHIADQDHIIRVRNAEIAALRKRAEKAEKERDQNGALLSLARDALAATERQRDEARADLAEYVQAQALRARPLTADAITDEMVERALAVERRVYDDGYTTEPGTMRELLTAALTEPTRPEGAEKIEGVLHQYWSGDINGDDLADRIAEEMNR